uniref:Wsv408 n=1 Tax=White spot syndrome virus TaxID=92652 RepID=A0A2U9GE08_WSSV|nr:wsv408 [Shrimp white spot syndrome virus]AWQ63066.1 wsv408 [Shrimp white spot syndrome virus]AWQ63501.1 wsv408 [Shrimp white spot syndrome virus]
MEERISSNGVSYIQYSKELANIFVGQLVQKLLGHDFTHNDRFSSGVTKGGFIKRHGGDIGVEWVGE